MAEVYTASPLLAEILRSIVPLMKPWCAKGEVPVGMNWDLYEGEKVWHPQAQ